MAENEIYVGILTISDRCASGEATDTSGHNLTKLISEGIIPNAKVTSSGCVADDADTIVEALLNWSDTRNLHLIITTGGTGFSRRDVTPEAVKQVIEREANGLTTLMMTSSLQVTPLAALSRPVCGIRGKTIIVTLPGSAKASEECLRFIAPVLSHGMDLLCDRQTRVEKTHKNLQATGVKMPKQTGHKHCSHSQKHFKSISSDDSSLSKVALRPRKSTYSMISVADAQEKVLGLGKTKPPIRVELSNAVGYVLAEEIVSKIALPPFRASIKDGYAVQSKDGKGLRKVVGTVVAGDTDAIEAGTDLTPFCTRINTGAPVPDIYDAVVQVEDTELTKASTDGSEEFEINILSSPSSGQDIRPVGCDITEGETVLSAGTYLGPAEIGVAASVGAHTLSVYPKPLVGLLSTGNELQTVSHAPLEPFRIFDSNIPTLRAMLNLQQQPCVCGGVAPDNEQDLYNALTGLLENNVDIIVTSGSVSMGEADLLRPVLKSKFSATIHFAQVFMKPGKPTTLASFSYKGQDRVVLGLPGNPVSATVTATLYLLPLCKKMSGWEMCNNTIIKAKLDHDITLDPRPEYHRAILSFSSESLPVATSTGNQLSSRLLSCTRATSLLVLPAKSESNLILKAGSVVEALLL